MKGSYERRGSKWSAIVDLPADPVTGKRRRRRLTADTKREVEQLVAATIQSGSGGFVPDGKILVRDFFEQWLPTLESRVRPSTMRRYQDLARLHLLPDLGNIRLAKLTTADVQRLYAGRLRAGLAPTTVRHVHGLLHRAMSDALRWDLVVRNVTEAVSPPRRSTPEAKTWDAHQVASVLASAASDDLECLWRLALITGMRRGEILGLRWGDVDYDNGSLFVRRTMSRGASSRLEDGEPKTVSGRRRIALPASVLESLRRHRLRQLEYRLAAGPAFKDQMLVFANETGGPLHPNTVANRFRKLTLGADVPVIRFHDLRHTCATLMMAQGEHPKVVQERLGHADVAMTINLYSHVMPDMQREAADRLDATLEAAKLA